MKALFACLFLALAAPVASAQTWPAKAVRIVVPFAPGGSADTLGRLVAQQLSEQLKQSFIVENRAGAGGVLGSELVAKAQPDGYTLVVSGIASHVIAPLLPQGTPYEPLRDFTHIALFGGPPAVFAVNPAVPARDLKEFVSLAKDKPGALTYGSPGNGTQGQLVAELFKRLAGIDVLHVPYKGASGAVADLMAGQITACQPPSLPQLDDPRRPRAPSRSASARLPDIRTFPPRGIGLPGPGGALSAPARRAPPQIVRLNGEVRRALELPDAKEKLRHEGIAPNRLDEGVHRFRRRAAAGGPIVRAPRCKND